MSAAFVASAAELETVPDGTVISWLRIPGDHTSEAVAFVRREVTNESGFPTVDVWISPGGWDPMTIDQAGVTFPATVIRWGEVPASDEFDASQLPLYTIPAMHGGTWSRETALKAAVELFRGDTLYVLPRNGDGPVLGPVLQVAEEFQSWLDRDTLSEIVNAGVITPEQANEAYAAWLDRDRAADGEPTGIILGDDTDKGTR
ncbi:hypothetical protein PBI_RICH_59 [Mycobacterium phage Rich]|uniref:Uncharacterized protein n=1 Tax=Mycobacterium phage Rich TaxID=1927021 RepID=A0A1L6BZ07_9CAUD|nr:hypothetical protein PBI_RICH_59 [Mycobacterium phage Rich]